MLNRVVRWSPGIGFKAVFVATAVYGYKRFKEIWYGLVMGVSMWMIDAAMHTSVHRQFTWNGFAKELIATDSSQLLFRGLFVTVSTALGISLWRSNRRKSQVDNLRASVDSLYREISSPLLLIVGYSQMLTLREGWPVSREAVEIVDEIQINARKIDDVIKRLPPPAAGLEEAIFDTRLAYHAREIIPEHYVMSSVGPDARSNDISARRV